MKHFHPVIGEYKIKVNPRAKRLILKITNQGQLEVVVPRAADMKRINGAIDRKSCWIEKSIAGIRKRNALADTETWKPKSIHFRFLDRIVNVTYQANDLNGVWLRTLDNDRIVISGQVQNKEFCGQVLREWLQDMGKRVLPAAAVEVMESNGFTVKRIQVRRQKSRWGSYSRNGTLSLNCKLLFFPSETVNYLIIHELCHTVHLNHSPEFWDLVSKHEPAYQSLDRTLNDAWKFVPAWAG